VIRAADGVLSRVTSAVVLRVLLFVALFSLAAVPPLDPDLWWHLANGRLMIAMGGWPHVDVYSFSAAGHPWIMHEWLADLGMYLAYRVGGLPLLVAIFAPGVFDAPATKHAAQILADWGASGPTLVVLSESEANAGMSFRNLKRVAVMPATDAGVADLIGAASLLVSESALTELVSRAKGNG